MCRLGEELRARLWRDLGGGRHVFDIEGMLLSWSHVCVRVCVCVREKKSTWGTELLCLSIKNIHHRQQKGLEAYFTHTLTAILC